MSIDLSPELETQIRQRAEAQGLTLAAYIEGLLEADQAADEELEALALEGLDSGDAIRPGPDYWQEKHRRLDEWIENNRK